MKIKNSLFLSMFPPLLYWIMKAEDKSKSMCVFVCVWVRVCAVQTQCLCELRYQAAAVFIRSHSCKMHIVFSDS